jgi:hypothetical protein
MHTAADRLTEMLTRLKLTAVRDQLDGLLDEAGRQDLSLRETLALLCEREIARKNEKAIAVSLRTVGWAGKCVHAASRAGKPWKRIWKHGRATLPTCGCTARQARRRSSGSGAPRLRHSNRSLAYRRSMLHAS